MTTQDPIIQDLLYRSRVLLPDDTTTVVCAGCGKPFQTIILVSGTRVGQPQYSRCRACRPKPHGRQRP